jgi:predicted transcriptional regulator
MEEEFHQPSQTNTAVRDRLVVTDPKVIRVVLHEQKLQILNILVHDMKNIQELKELTKINPGTIKRNLDELMEHGLIFIAAIKKSDYNITMKYYRATANHIEISYLL